MAIEEQPLPALPGVVPVEGSSALVRPTMPSVVFSAHRAAVMRRRVRLAAGLVAVVDGLVSFVSLVPSGASPAFRLLFAVLVVLTLMAWGEYRLRLTLSALADAPRLVGRLVVPAFLAVLIAYGLSPSAERVVWLVVAVVAVVAARALSFAVIRLARMRRWLAEPTLVVGAGSVGAELIRLLDEHRRYGLAVVGAVDDLALDPSVPVLGRLGDLDRLIGEHHVQRVIIAFTPAPDDSLIEVIRDAVQREATIYIVPRFFEVGLAPTGPDVDAVWDIPLYRVRRSSMSELIWHAKRAIDLLVSSIALVLLAPLLALLALAVRLSSPGPILFRQTRIGQHGRPFQVLKFRTLRVNDDSDVTWNVTGDDRQTPVGKWLRRLSLDELPQIFNVLRGDMSLVGPRPERPYFVERFRAAIPGYDDRHRQPVGLTGLAQIHGLRGDTSVAERARFDNAYIEHWSPWLDITILVRTVTAVIRDAVRPHRGTRTPAPAAPGTAGVAGTPDASPPAPDPQGS